MMNQDELSALNKAFGDPLYLDRESFVAGWKSGVEYKEKELEALRGFAIAEYWRGYHEQKKVIDKQSTELAALRGFINEVSTAKWIDDLDIKRYLEKHDLIDNNGNQQHCLRGNDENTNRLP